MLIHCNMRKYHTPYFGISCESPIEFEFLKTRGPGFIPLNPISKSLWTCSVESAIEYCRIVWDLFPQGKLVRFIASDTVAHILNTWSPTQQNLNHIMNGMSLIGVPPPPPSRSVQPGLDFTVLHGLRAAIEALSECTDLQHEKRKAIAAGDDQVTLVNRCRVVCITSARDNDSMKRLEEIFQNVLQQQNKVAASSDRFLTIDHCHLVIINTFPVNIESHVSNHAVRHLSPILKTEVHSVKAPFISNKLSSLILDHYDLASTTVTGIPMKEEQNASSSANYDVEIYHSKDAHTAILRGNSPDSLAIRTVKEGLEYETVTLKWCTPRGSATSELQNCTSMHRITPVDVNSRPSLCLINFLLNGRSVMLEMPRKAGGKISSHLLASHGGEIFIHTLCTARSVLEDPPSISEGVGGRVTDYRITDFGLLIQQNRLFPLRPSYNTEKVNSISKMKARLSRHTKYWPLTISSTLIFNLKNCIDPLPSIITKERITEEEVVQCKQVIYNLISLEAKHESLHLPNTGQRSKGQKREEQYKIMWNELETLLKNNCHTENHRAVYNCLIECHKFNSEDGTIDVDQALSFVDPLGKSDSDVQRASVIRATTDSPMSPPPLASIAPPLSRNILSNRSGSIYSSTPRTLYDIFTSQDKSKQRPDFAGRSDENKIAKLYPNLKIENEWGPRGEGMEVE
ncbi:integrator complex subunit 13 isoform X2 [Agrilus planipennis]|uniref:Protein asunder n=1 Tax=Agrilus planipennis TaxID=224129 RepID=A0A1W4WR92_AGRPL|nr:integrator complex subunit 13 isoform X2 [Agrilus planipennis]